jgi:hypothetical protein
MINQDLARQWIAEMKNPANKKTTGALKRTDGECCLGLYCRAVKKIEPEKVIGIDKFAFLGKGEFLPDELAQELNITNQGSLTDAGVELLKEKFSEHIDLVKPDYYYSDLTDWNDNVYEEDTDFLNMVRVIETLVDHERDNKVECFLPYGNYR